MRTIFLSLLLSICLFIGCKKNNVEPEEPKQTMYVPVVFAKSTNVFSKAVATDDAGNVYITGSFGPSATLGNTVLTLPISTSGTGMFVAKYNSSGTVLWATQIKDSYISIGTAIVVDNLGNVYVSGSYSYEAIFDTQVLAPPLPQDRPQYSNFGFVAKYNAMGEVQWVRNVSNKGLDLSESYSLAVDKANNLYITGYFDGLAVFGTTTLTHSTNSHLTDVFIAKYSPVGDVLWAKKAVEGDATSTSLVLDGSGNAYITGSFTSTALFDGTSLAVKGLDYRSDIFLAKYDPSGKMEWVRQAGGEEGDASTYMVADKAGNVYLTGAFSKTATFNNVALAAKGIIDIFLAKYTPSGEVSWVRSGGYSKDTEISGDIGTMLMLDQTDHVYLIGRTRTNAVFDQLTLKENYLNSFMATYTTAGEIRGLEGWSIADSYKASGVPVIYTGLSAAVSSLGTTGYITMGSIVWKFKLN